MSLAFASVLDTLRPASGRLFVFLFDAAIERWFVIIGCPSVAAQRN
jgi:hypothetical protein